MPIFKYNFKQNMAVKSTWIILILTIAFLTLGWSIPIVVYKLLARVYYPKFTFNKVLLLIVFKNLWKEVFFSLIVSTMLLIFIGFKIAQIFRSDIDNETINLVLSKPVSRGQIWWEKWLCLQLIVFLYLLLVFVFTMTFIALPFLGGIVVFKTILPFVFFFFAVSVFFQFLFTSIALILPMLFNSKIVIAIIITSGALISLTATIDKYLKPSQEYYNIAQAAETYQTVEENLTVKEFKNFLKLQTEYNNNKNKYEEKIIFLVNSIDKNYINKNGETNFYQPENENKIFTAIYQEPDKYQNIGKNEINLIKEVVPIISIFRQSEKQSIQSILINKLEKGENPNSYFNLVFTFTNLNTKINGNIVNYWKKIIWLKTINRYCNIFYHFYYLWSIVFNNDNNSFGSTQNYLSKDNFSTIQFLTVEDNQYKLDLNSNIHKIINSKFIICFYIILSTVITLGSCLIFKNKDFK